MEINQARIQQVNFLKKVEDVLPANTSLVYELSELLNISTDSAYRRMRGETALSIFEVIHLCEYFKISFEGIQKSESGLVTFAYNRMNKTEESFLDFLKSINNNLEVIRNAETKYIKYASEDIPVFYNYKYPALSAFKMFYWMKSIMNVPKFENVKFSEQAIPEEFKNIGVQIAEKYMEIPSIEIWTETTIRSTIKQIEYYWESGKFESAGIAQWVIEAFRSEIESIQQQAERETKLPANNNSYQKNYTLYYSDIELTNNCVLVSIGDAKSVFLGHQTFNTMDTHNAEYCIETEAWIDDIIRKSTLISGVSEKLRYQFFNKMFKEIDELRDRCQC